MKKLATNFILFTLFLFINIIHLSAQTPWCSSIHKFQSKFNKSTYLIALDQLKITTTYGQEIYASKKEGFIEDTTCGSEWKLENDTNNAIELIAGQKYVIYYSVSSTLTNTNSNVGCFIDYNNDNDFNDNGEFVGVIFLYSNNSSYVNYPSPFTINIPCSANLGNLRMRIICNLAQDTVKSYSACSNCNNNSIVGETNDYTIKIIKPNADATISGPNTAFVKTEVTFEKTNRIKSISHSWDANNDGTYEKIGQDPKYAYIWSTTGTKCLKTTSSNCTSIDIDTLCINIISPSASPVVNFVASEDTVEQYQSIQFTDLSTNGPWQWEWDIYDTITYKDDINYSSQDGIVGLATGEVYGAGIGEEQKKNPIFYFDLPGKYNVVLKATNDIGQTVLQKNKYIIVAKPTNYMLGFGVHGENGDNRVSSLKGKIYDNGGPSSNYTNNLGIKNRSFLTIKPCKATTVTLKMTQLKFKDSGDVLSVYEGESADPSKLLARYTVNATGNRIVTSNVGSMYVTFESNGSGVDSGFAGHYYCTQDTSLNTVANFNANSIYYNSVPFELKSTSTVHSGDPKYEWYINGASYPNNTKTNFKINLTQNGFYNILLEIEECDEIDTISKYIQIITPNTPTNVDFKSSKTFTTNIEKVYLTPLTDKANRFLWKITPNSYKVLSPITSPSYKKDGFIYYRSIKGDSLPVPEIQFLDTVCYTIKLIAYNSLDSVNTVDSFTKTNYVCAKPYQSYYNLYGTIFLDKNSNCQLDSTDTPLENYPVIVYDSTNAFIAKLYTQNDGIYAYNLQDKKYKIQLDTAGNGLISGCPSIGLDSIVNKNTNPTFNGANFPLKCTNKSTFKITSLYTNSIVFPGRIHQFRVLTQNIFDKYCQSNIDLLSLKLQFLGKVKYLNAEKGYLSPNSVSGNTIVHDLKGNKNLNNLYSYDLKVDTTAVGNDTILAKVELIFIEKNDTFKIKTKLKYVVRNSYDPNFKEVSPIETPIGYNDWMTYTIHFQNKGNAPAFNIRIADTLDQNLQPESFQVLSSSHQVRPILSKRIITFRFDDIMLPDSASDPKGSMGYVQYRIKPISPINLGTKVKNTAYIYFDYNPAIITNTTLNEPIENNTKISTTNFIQLKVYPNPSKGIYNLYLNQKMGENASLKIYDTYGKTMKILTLSNGLNQVNLSDLISGTYFFQIEGINASATAIVIKE